MVKSVSSFSDIDFDKVHYVSVMYSLRESYSIEIEGGDMSNFLSAISRPFLFAVVNTVGGESFLIKDVFLRGKCTKLNV